MADESNNLEILAAFMIGGLLVSLGMWIAVLGVLRRGGAPIPWLPRRPVPWGLSQILVVAVLYVVLHSQVSQFTHDGTGEMNARVLFGSAAASALTLVIAIAALRSGFGASWADLGLPLGPRGVDLLRGGMVFLTVVPPIYILQGLLSQWFPEPHPIIDVYKAHRDDATKLAIVLAAVVVAPLTEEFFFRGLLQGWLEKVWLAPRRPAALLEPPQLDPPLVAEKPEIVTPPPGAARVGPIVISSAAFAAVHIGHGPAPIPLFFLALALGYLYQQTHRLWPCIVLHMALNASSILMLFLGLEE